MDKDRVIIALHDQFSATRIRDFLARHDWRPETEFHVAHVLELSGPPWRGDPSWDAGVMKARKSASSLVGEFADVIRGLSSNLFVTEHVLEGRAAEELVRLAQNKSASLIVMGCRGRVGLRRLLLGSVSGAVAQKAPCSVVILKKNHLAMTQVRKG